MAQIRTRKIERIQDNQRRIIEYLDAHPCADCLETDLLVLELDHVRGKRAGVSVLMTKGYEWQYILDEIERCEVVCANCHRRRTAERANNYRFQALMAKQWAARESDPEPSG